MGSAPTVAVRADRRKDGAAHQGTATIGNDNSPVPRSQADVAVCFQSARFAGADRLINHGTNARATDLGHCGLRER
jgi:hypothetical protein